MTSAFEELCLNLFVKFINTLLCVPSLKNDLFRRKSKRPEQSQLWMDEICPVPGRRGWSSQVSSVCALF